MRPEITITFNEVVKIINANLTSYYGDTFPLSQSSSDSTNVTWIFLPKEDLSDVTKYILLVTVEDNAQNEKTYPIKIIIDRTPPKREGYTPNTTIIDTTPKISFNFSKSGVVPIVLVRDVASGSIINITSELISPNENKTFSFTFNDPLVDGRKEVMLSGEDYAGNPVSTSDSYSFTINSNPLNIQLLYPKFGFSTTPTGNLTITTSQDATCKWSLINESFDVMDSFTKVNSVTHIEKDFPMSQKTVYVKCIDQYGSYFLKLFDIDYRTSASNFVVEATPNPIIEPSQTTTLKVTSDDKLQCKISNTTTDFNFMTQFPGYDESNFSGYQKENPLLLSYSVDDQNAYSYLYNISCINLAGFISEPKPYTITLDLRVPLQIEIIYPKDYADGSNVNLTVRTNKNATCWFDDFDVSPGSSQLGMSNSLLHSVVLGNLAGGRYTYQVLCRKAEEARITVSFVVDRTPPGKTQIEVDNITCDNTLSASFESIDNESTIAYYTYQIKDSYANALRDWFNSTKDEVKFTFNNMSTLRTYTFYAKATNKAGLTGDLGQSYGIRYDPNNTMCKEKIPPNVNLTLTPYNKAINVTILCFDNKGGSGCDYNNIYYGTSLETANCTANIIYTFPVTIFSSKKLCYKVRDLAGNEKFGEKNITIAEEPVIEQCNNFITDGFESDVDCGKSCSLKCEVGKHCNTSNDCISDYCDPLSNKCGSISCNDSIKNGGESDIDCGQVCINKCEIGRSCITSSDCTSNICKDLVCVAPSCDDGMLNGNESDTDCGGVECPLKCDLGKNCRDNVDCQTDYCDDEFGKCDESSKKDTDGDGMPDDWEVLYGLDKKDPTDAQEDPDNDGLTNLEEFMQKTDPFNPDTDDDGCSDGKEADQGLDPNDPLITCEPEGLPLWIIALIAMGIIAAIGGGVYYYKVYLPSKETLKVKPSAVVFKPVQTRARSEEEKKKRAEMDEKYKTRMEERANKRKDLLGVFGENPEEAKPPEGEIKEGETKEGEESKKEEKKDKKIYSDEEWIDFSKDKDKIEKKDVFDELDSLSGKKSDNKQKVKKNKDRDVFDELDDMFKKKEDKPEKQSKDSTPQEKDVFAKLDEITKEDEVKEEAKGEQTKGESKENKSTNDEKIDKSSDDSVKDKKEGGEENTDYYAELSELSDKNKNKKLKDKKESNDDSIKKSEKDEKETK